MGRSCSGRDAPCQNLTASSVFNAAYFYACRVAVERGQPHSDAVAKGQDCDERFIGDRLNAST